MSPEQSPSATERESAIKHLAANVSTELVLSLAERMRNKQSPWHVDDNSGLKLQFVKMIRRLGFGWSDEYLDGHWHELVEEAVTRRQAGAYDFDLRIVDLLRFAGPLLFANEDVSFPYSLGATCMLVKFRGTYYGITPAHCLKDRNDKSIRIGAVEQSEIFLPIRRVIRINNSETFDTDWCDLAFFEIADDRISREEMARRSFFELDDHHGPALKFAVNTPLVFKGYPFEISKVDYDLKEIGRLSVIGDCSFRGPAESRICGIVQFNDLTGITNANGLSGSPLIRFDPLDALHRPTLAGVILRATKESMAGRFVYVGSILKALTQVR
ncbi:MAG: hypothetical protein ABSA97_07650 [Verrucomicrobiia bacterium]